MKGCRTTNEGPRRNVSCILPFKFEAKLKYGCISDTDPDGRLWCSTKVDENLNHVGGGGHWGYCQPSCPEAGVNICQINQNFSQVFANNITTTQKKYIPKRISIQPL